MFLSCDAVSYYRVSQKTFLCPIKRFSKSVCFVELYLNQEVFWGQSFFNYETKECFFGTPDMNFFFGQVERFMGPRNTRYFDTAQYDKQFIVDGKDGKSNLLT